MDGPTLYVVTEQKKWQKEVFMLFLDGSIRDMLDIWKCPFCGVWSSIGISTAKRSILICIFSINICSLPKDEKNLYAIMLFRVILNYSLLLITDWILTKNRIQAQHATWKQNSLKSTYLDIYILSNISLYMLHNRNMFPFLIGGFLMKQMLYCKAHYPIGKNYSF